MHTAVELIHLGHTKISEGRSQCKEIHCQTDENITGHTIPLCGHFEDTGYLMMLYHL